MAEGRCLIQLAQGFDSGHGAHQTRPHLRVDEPRRDDTSERLVLEGGGGFYVCEDRQMRGAREIVAPPGSAIFLRCPRLRGTTGRVYHYVADIDTPRTTFGLRHDRGRDEWP